MYTLTKVGSYNDQGSEICQDMDSVFRKSVHKGRGPKSPNEFASGEHAWVNAFESVPG